MRGRIVVALVLLAIGIAWLLDLAGYLAFPGGFATWWPSILIAIGVIQLLFAGKRWRAPFVLILVGAILQAWTLDLIPSDWWRYAAPVALIVIALLILLPPWPAWTKQEPWRTGHIHNEPRRGHLGPEDVAVFSEQRLDAPAGTEYRGGELTAVFGTLDADLTRATLPPEGARMKATSVFGGVKIRVPAGWRVSVRGTPVLGATLDRTAHVADGPKLDVEAVAVFGNVEIVNG